MDPTLIRQIVEAALLAAPQPLTLGQGQLIDRIKGLAGHGDATAEAFIEVGERAAAPDQPVAALDHPVGVGADHFEVARDARGEAFAIVRRRLGLVINHARDGDEGGVGGRPGDLEAETFIEGPVAVRADDPGRAGRAFAQFRAGGVARGHDGTPGVPRHAELVHLLDHARRGTRRIGDQDYLSVVAVEPGQGRAGLGPAFTAVMDHPPDVAEQDVVVGGDVGQAGDGEGQGHGGLIAFWRARVKA